MTLSQSLQNNHNSIHRPYDRKKFKEAEWIEGESIRAFMSTQLSMIVSASIVIPIIFVLLFQHVYLLGLLAWVLLSILLTIYRLKITNHYVKNLAGADTRAQIEFKVKHAWIWPTTSGLWGLLVLLFFANAPLFNQFVCWVTIASIGVFSSTTYSSHLKTMKQFIDAMFIVIFLGMAWRYLTNSDGVVESMLYYIAPMQLIYWFLLRTTGERLNQVHLQRLRLLIGNYELIDSLEAETLRANQAVETKNRFLASAAHDIRQPVLALDLYSSMLRSEPEMATQLTEKIEIATKSVISMFDSLFDLSRLDTGQLNIKNSDVDLAKLMRDLELQYKPAADAKKLQFRLRFDHCSIHTDEQLLKRILGNLLMNAIKFTAVGGVLMAARCTPQGIKFEVWDTGIGIPQGQQLAVLQEFYKSPSHPGTSEGFGLGLNIVTRFCETLGFQFSMKSKMGRGSVFQVFAPNTPPSPSMTEAGPVGAHKK